MKIPAELEQYNLERPQRQVKRRLVLTSEGGPGTGKTDLFYRSAPRPALIIQLDLNDEGIDERYEADQDLLIKRIRIPATVGERTAEHRDADMKLWAPMRDLYIKSVMKHHFRSVMIDEGMALYEFTRRAFLIDLGFGGSSQASYAPINAAMKRLYTLAKQERINLYIPHRQTDERENGVNEQGKKTSTLTGRKKAAGWKDALYESQCHILLEKDEDYDLQACDECGLRPKRDRKSKGCTCEEFTPRDPANKFRAVIKKCTARTEIEGRVLVGRKINWLKIGSLVFPQSEPEEWE